MLQNTPLWELNKGDGTPVSYLFGSVHVRDLRAYPWFDLALERLHACQAFAAEIPLGESDAVQGQNAMRLSDAPPLYDLLKPASWRRLDRLSLRLTGAPALIWNNAHPMIVFSILNAAMLHQEMPYALDEALWREADKVGKHMLSVEQLDDQIEVVRRIPIQQHVANLNALLRNQSAIASGLNRMLAQYGRGDIRSLYHSARSQMGGMRRVMLYERNRAMSARFAEIASGQSLFCVVGAAHLAGARGMLRYLKHAGFKLRGISS